MNFLVTLVLLGQIIGCTSLSVEFDCNGEEAEELAKLAMQYINSHNLHGYKQTLNIIKDFAEWFQRPKMVAEITLNVLETKCHVLDPTPVENCTVRQQHEHVSV
uniref:Cystatin fetuin-A-type domain-containing protein n=1 Tax=Naja naja TaxID=35670 RepID=A0A8C6XAV3_NAJNA